MKTLSEIQRNALNFIIEDYLHFDQQDAVEIMEKLENGEFPEDVFAVSAYENEGPKWLFDLICVECNNLVLFAKNQMNKKFYVATLDERNGEYQYTHHIRMAISADSEPEEVLNRHASEFYDGDREESNDGYFFNCGCVFVSAGGFKEVTEQTYLDLDGIVSSLELMKEPL